jgi:hypothetical protein
MTSVSEKGVRKKGSGTKSSDLAPDPFFLIWLLTPFSDPFFPRCRELMKEFILKNPGLWDEDIGA